MSAKQKTRPRWTKPLEVPRCPEGWHTGPPDFVGVGAQRSGTSWWYRTIEQHPHVVRIEGQSKELHYFGRFWDGDIPADLESRYHSFFPRPPGSLTGEWTPRYMYDHWSLRLLARSAPDARILILLRDPVERYRSGLGRLIRRGGDTDLNLMMFADALNRGLYHAQLQRVLDHFPAERVLVLQYEQCTRDTLDQLATTCEFLGLEPFTELPAMASERKRPPNPNPELSEAMRQDLVARLADDVQALLQLCPHFDVSLWRNFAHLAPVEAPTPTPGGTP